jgi:phage terminase large subunit-like protein
VRRAVALAHWRRGYYGEKHTGSWQGGFTRMPRQGQTRRLNGKLYHYDRGKAQRVVEFFQDFLHFTEGEQAETPFVLAKWQKKEVIEPFFGWLREDETRQYRFLYCNMPKKSGKTEFVAGLALNALCNDDEKSPEVYSAGAVRAQATIAWRRAQIMVSMDEHLSEHLVCLPGQKRIVNQSNNGFYQALSAEAYGNHGYNISCCIFDELHQQPDAELYNCLRNGIIGRGQPMFCTITNAGADQTSICYQVHKHAELVRANPEQDPEFLGVLYGVDYEEDWTSPKVWRKANPMIGKIVDVSFYRSECKRAQDNPGLLNNFRRYYLGTWVSQSVVWMPMHRWDKCAFPVDAQALEGRQCWAGLDLAQVQDLAALVLVFPPVDDGDRWEVLPFAWIPEERIQERIKTDQIHYDVWVRQGFLETTPGDVVDFDNIKRKLQELDSKYLIRQIAVDPHQAVQLIVDLNEWYAEKYPRVEDKEVWAVKCPQGYQLSAAMKMLLEGLVLQEKLAHANHPVLRWNLDNMVAKTGRQGDLMPDRFMARKKIDLGVALIMAIKAAGEGKGPLRQRKPSPYNARGIRTIEDIIREDEERERREAATATARDA